jgi:pyrrolidone-carboxylate peptidase
MRGQVVALMTLLASAGVASGYTRNIMVVGFWPPTNELARQWSTNPDQNPGGWQGQNWEGRGYDIYSYFPEFPGMTGPNYGRGVGDFEVDYQDTSNDFWRIVAEIRPIAIISFSRGSSGSNWEIESRAIKYPLANWTPDYLAPTRPTADLPIAQEPDNMIRYSSLPMTQIYNAVSSAGLPLTTFIDTSNDFAGTFVSNFQAYHSSWYADMNSEPFSENWCIAGGHIHVGIDTPQAVANQAAVLTMRELTSYLDTVIPAPSSLLALGAGLVMVRRRR